MLLKDIITNLDKSDHNCCDNIKWDMETLIQDLNLSCYGVNQSETYRLKSYWVGKHLCTDTHVGIKAYFLDDEFVCLGVQQARKSDESIRWLSDECASNVRQYILSLSNEDSYYSELLDMEEDFGDGYQVEFTGQLLTKVVNYKGDLVTVVKDNGQGFTNFHTITVEKDNQLFEVDVRGVHVPWPVTTKDNTMTYQEFLLSYDKIKGVPPTYRIGQYFCKLFIKDSSTLEMCKLWEEKDVDKALLMIDTIIKRYDWCYGGLPLLNKE